MQQLKLKLCYQEYIKDLLLFLVPLLMRYEASYLCCPFRVYFFSFFFIYFFISFFFIYFFISFFFIYFFISFFFIYFFISFFFIYFFISFFFIYFFISLLMRCEASYSCCPLRVYFFSFSF